MTSATTGEDVQTTTGLVITPGPNDTSSITNFEITGITGGTLFLNDGVTPVTDGQFVNVTQGAAGLKFTPTSGSLANGSFTVYDSTTADTSGLVGEPATGTITVLVPTPTVTNATTGEDAQTSSLPITPGPVDASLVNYFQITGIMGGSLFLNDGVTPVTDGDFITLAQGAAGLTFTPTDGSLISGSFTVQDSITADTSGLLGDTATATITVLTPTPDVTNATTGEDVQTTSGLVVTPGPIDTSLVTKYQITGIAGGSLFLNDGVTPVTNGEFITAAQGEAGLTFTPTSGSLANGSFDVEEWTAIGRVGNVATGTITVLAPIANVTNATTGENAQTTSGLVITPGPVDTSLVNYFEITGITGGSLFLNHGVTSVTNGEFITFAQGAAGLTFTPTAGSLTSGSFTVQDSTTADTSGLLGTSTAATITVLAPTISIPSTLSHGTLAISWAGLGLDPASNTADVSAYKGQQAFQIAGDQPIVGTCNWDTTTVPDGHYELCVTFENAAGNSFSQATCEVLVNNTAAWYSGTVTTDDTWTSAQVNIVNGNVTIPAGVTVTIQPGAIVKFAQGCGITIESGGTLDASQAAQAAPIIFTSLADDSVGGDTNMDGGKTLPMPGDWAGIAIQGNGAFLDNQYTDLRYLVEAESGTLSASEDWLGAWTYHVTGELSIPAGVTLTIDPGAVVKFGSGVGIDVLPGGTLIADGTVAQPIIFTSIKDDANGGDTNGDGSATSPAAGDWNQILVQGSATFDHVWVLYGSGIGQTGMNGGAIHNAGGALSFSNSILSQALYDGLDTYGGGSAVISNSLFTDTNRAVVSTVSSMSIVNSTFDDNVIGMYAHVGGTLTAANCIVSNNSQAGVASDGSGLTITYSDVWNPAASAGNYSGMPDQTGQNGNISANPDYVDAASGNYRLGYGLNSATGLQDLPSPCIDAGNGAVAPPTDMMGDPRSNDPAVTDKSGVRDANGNYPDMGAYEFVESATSNLDMTVTSVTGPASATAGSSATIQWTDANIGSGTVIGPWHDSVYLVRNPGPNQTEILAGQILVGQGVTLGPGQSDTFSATILVPGDAAGTHYWAVKVNSAGDIFVGQNTANTTLVSSAPVELSVPALPIDGAAVSGQFSGVGNPQWFEFTPQAGQDILVSLNLADNAGAAELYIGQGYMPSALDYDAKESQWNSPNVTALAASTSGQPYYVLAEPTSLSGATSAFTIQAAALIFQLNSVSPGTVGNAGSATLELQGGKLTSGMTYQVVDPSGTAHDATAVYVVSSADVYATFNLTGAVAGTYKVEVQNGSQTLTAPTALQVIQTSLASSPQVVLTAPSRIRAGGVGTAEITVTNTSNNDLPAPLIELTASNATLKLPSQAAYQGDSLYFLATSPTGLAGVLTPGESVQIAIQVESTNTSQITLQIANVDGSQAINWTTFASQTQPTGVDATTWAAVINNLFDPDWDDLGRLCHRLGQRRHPSCPPRASHQRRHGAFRVRASRGRRAARRRDYRPSGRCQLRPAALRRRSKRPKHRRPLCRQRDHERQWLFHTHESLRWRPEFDADRLSPFCSCVRDRHYHGGRARRGRSGYASGPNHRTCDRCVEWWPLGKYRGPMHRPDDRPGLRGADRCRRLLQLRHTSRRYLYGLDFSKGIC